eukprot:3026408-Pleurochrysis_carterae.AAC.1
MDSDNKEKEELTLRQIIASIILEWQKVNETEKYNRILTMRLWTGEMMNWARTQTTMWLEKNNEHKAIQRRWDNRGRMNKAFRRWKKYIGNEHHEEQKERKDKEEEGVHKEKTYEGIKHWGEVRNGCLRTSEAHILVRGVSTTTIG